MFFSATSWTKWKVVLCCVALCINVRHLEIAIFSGLIILTFSLILYVYTSPRDIHW